ncbi:MAG: hypothetical protein KDK07_21695 [Bauldia sp.]|nr:hypothetical protein [Bauldia sp.]
MAKFYATGEADIVGSTDLISLPTVGAAPVTTNNFAVVNTTDYYDFYTETAPIALGSNIKSWSHLTYNGPFTTGKGEVDQMWKADSGDTYLLSDIIALFVTPGVVLGKTAFTEQEGNQFFFKFDDAIHGSDEDDMLCGWAGKDKIWGEEGDDEFYYGQGMGKDKIMDLNKKKDSVILDTDLVKNFNKLVGDVVLKNGKVVLKFSSSEKLVIYGIDNFSDLKKVVAFDDFTDFS